MAIYKYPLVAPVTSSGNRNVEAPTDAIDYLCLKRSRVRYKTQVPLANTVINGKHKHNADTGLTGVQKERMPDTVYISMPPQLSTSYQAAYSHQDIGVMGLGLAEGWDNITNNDTDSLVGTIQSAAGLGLPEFASVTAANIANAFGNTIGLAGKVDKNSLEQMTRGRVFNPFSEQIFKSMAFRQHAFNFKMVAKSENEAKEIWKIIRWIKLGATPKIEAGGDTAADYGTTKNDEGDWSGFSDMFDQQKNKIDPTKAFDRDQNYLDMLEQSKSQRFFQVPDHFDLKFIRAKPGDESSWWNPQGGFQEGQYTNSMHFKIHTSFCSGVSVNYTPDGQYSSFKSVRSGAQIQVPVVALSLQFIETRLVSQQDIGRGY